MFEFSIEVRNLNLLVRYITLMQRLPRLMQILGAGLAAKYEPVLQARLSNAPPPPTHFQFSTPRQQRAYYATNAWGMGIPYPRTLAIEQGWKIDVQFGTAEVPLTLIAHNDAPGIQFVEGFRQQLGHENRWPYAPDVVVEVENEMVDEFAERIGQSFEIAEAFA